MKILIPDTLKHDQDLEITFPTELKDIQAAVYESPRAHYDKDDILKKNPIWRGDIFETSHLEDIVGNKIILKMRRGPENKRAYYGNYLVRASGNGVNHIEEEKIIKVLPKP